MVRPLASLQDIARLARCSTSTVSRVIGGVPGPSEATRARVMAAAQRLGYRPNRLARAIVTRRSGLIGVAVADLGDPFFTELIAGAQERAGEGGCQLLVASSRRDPAVECGLVEDFRSYQADGIVLCGTPQRSLEAELATAQAMTAAQAAGVPVIQIGLRRGPAPLLRVDFPAIAADAFRHLAALGHRIVGYLGDIAVESLQALHLRGIERAAAEAGLAFDRRRTASVGSGGEEMAAAVARLTTSGATALIAADDMHAVAAILALRDSGRQVPGDVSVMGMDGTTLPSQLLHPRLSTVALPLQALGALAVSEVLRILDGGEPRYEITLPHSVVARGSTAAPANRRGAARPPRRLP
jgi:DNA-binding LacI/PurR family transcriptional regulator